MGDAVYLKKYLQLLLTGRKMVSEIHVEKRTKLQIPCKQQVQMV